MEREYSGRCHCGAVRFGFECAPVTRGLHCNCSICIRKGAMMSPDPIPPDKFHIDADGEALGLYEFGAKTAKHYFCRHCGIYTFHITVRKPGHYRANLGCVAGIDPFSLEAEFFDGKHLL